MPKSTISTLLTLPLFEKPARIQKLLFWIPSLVILRLLTLVTPISITPILRVSITLAFVFKLQHTFSLWVDEQFGRGGRWNAKRLLHILRIELTLLEGGEEGTQVD